MRSLSLFVSLVAALSYSPRLAAQPAPAPDTALLMAGTNLSKNGNFYVYYDLNGPQITIKPGDVLEYDLFIPGNSTMGNGGADIMFHQDVLPVRDLGTPDQNGLRVHPEEVIPQAKDTWYHREIKLDKAAKSTVRIWALVLEGDLLGPYSIFVDNMGIRHADGTWTWAYQNGAAPKGAHVDGNNGYSKTVVLRAVPRSEVTAARAPALVAREVKRAGQEQLIADYQHDVEYVENFAKNAPANNPYTPDIAAARAALDKMKAEPDMSPEALTSLITSGRQRLAHTHPMMQKFTGYLVGHSHIDFQWLWEWPESLKVCHDTFNTVCNLMEEFPGFAFSQSSSALYRVTEQFYPDVFKRIQQKVKAGTWDIVGGRVCEGDTNLVSPESHARQFLLGQRYFRKTFGRTATVGWEPDTFGHTWSMPQIAKMGGLEYYYFCRGGKGDPLFWWEGPDGTKMLTFDEVASGSWYNGDLTNSTLNEVFNWSDKTGTNSIMWVYGVGDHGGGVTREQLNVAKDWMKTPYYPNVKFATAGKFFDTLAKGDLSKIPTVQDELNHVFEGCYTTHAYIKRLNRDAENITASAESISAVAATFGRPYPRQQFDDNWEGIVFNHHHDTLPGTAIHESYDKTREQLESIVTSSRNIAGDSMRFLATFMTQMKGAEYNIAVYNPLGWTHTAVAELPWPYQPGDDDQKWVAVAPSGEIIPVTVVRGQRPDNPHARPMVTFTAKDVPGFGYRVFGLRRATDADKAYDTVTVTPGPSITLENARLRVTVNGGNGLVTSLFDKAGNRETLAPGGAGNRLEIWHETADGMSAWTIGKYSGHEALDGPATVKVIENTPGRAIVRVDRDYNRSHITQYIALRAGADQVETPLWVDWQEWGKMGDGGPFLKVACDVAGTDLKARYEIPFATMERPMDGRETVALKSGDLSNNDYGVTLLNDSKSGYSAEGNTLRLSLLRTSFDPDKMADQGEHFINTALLPHKGAYGAAEARAGFAFNQRLLTARVAPTADQTLPLEKSFVQVAGDSVIATVLKQSEDNPNAMVVRLYEAGGTPSTVRISADKPLSATQWVNFIEDPLAPKQAGPVAATDLRKFEIRNALLIR
jgi:alpha-mannosidase